ncbi:MAG: GNAT family N-acetyltransferase [Magnetospirillum sp.]|nr:MAG: GNAT family N-acetyltransferase [Magnetospirillum sp.]
MTHIDSSAIALQPAPSEEVEVRMARGPDEIEAAQRLRYRVFYEEMGAKACPRTRSSGLDQDDYDRVCDHLLAFAGRDVIGTYRLIRRSAAAQAGGFYSAAEFDIGPLVRHPGEILELGRSCVDANWRNRGVLNALWQGLAAYIAQHQITLLFGCASLPGTDTAALAPQLAYLKDHHLAPEELRAKALADRRAEAAIAAYDSRRTLCSLPPLLKGYLRAGAWVGEGAVIDAQFNTTDVLVTLDTALLGERYLRTFGQKGSEAA